MQLKWFPYFFRFCKILRFHCKWACRLLHIEIFRFIRPAKRKCMTRASLHFILHIFTLWFDYYFVILFLIYPLVRLASIAIKTILIEVMTLTLSYSAIEIVLWIAAWLSNNDVCWPETQIELMILMDSFFSFQLLSWLQLDSNGHQNIRFVHCFLHVKSIWNLIFIHVVCVAYCAQNLFRSYGFWYFYYAFIYSSTHSDDDLWINNYRSIVFSIYMQAYRRLDLYNAKSNTIKWTNTQKWYGRKSLQSCVCSSLSFQFSILMPSEVEFAWHTIYRSLCVCVCAQIADDLQFINWIHKEMAESVSMINVFELKYRIWFGFEWNQCLHVFAYVRSAICFLFISHILENVRIYGFCGFQTFASCMIWWFVVVVY